MLVYEVAYVCRFMNFLKLLKIFVIFYFFINFYFLLAVFIELLKFACDVFTITTGCLRIQARHRIVRDLW